MMNSTIYVISIHTLILTSSLNLKSMLNKMTNLNSFQFENHEEVNYVLSVLNSVARYSEPGDMEDYLLEDFKSFVAEFKP